MTVSVVIPTRNRPEQLRQCLAALAAQDTAPTEVVVVDDGSAQSARVGAIARESEAKLIRLDGRGPAAARNAGAREASGEVLCFTDDDCEPEPGWVGALTTPILRGDARCASGTTLPAGGAGAADRAWHAIVSHLQRTAMDRGSPSRGFAPTCNLAATGELLTDLRFDESFPAAAGEDRDWATRAASLGAPPLFVPDAVVVHRPGLTARSFLRQQYRYGRGAARYRRGTDERELGSPGFYAGLLRAGFAAGPAAGALVCAAQLATAAGVVAEHYVNARAEVGRPSRLRPHR